MIGYRTGTVEYERGDGSPARAKYPLKKMLSFAMEGITSLSVSPSATLLAWASSSLPSASSC